MKLLDRDELERWREFIEDAIAKWVAEEPSASLPADATPIGAGAAWRPTQSLDSPADDLPPGWCSLGHDPESIAEHLQVQAALRSDELNDAITEWSRTWVRPRLSGDPGFYYSLRLQCARDTIIGMLDGQPLPGNLADGAPEWSNNHEALKWFLITLWDAIGNFYLQMWAKRERSRMRFKIDPGVDKSPADPG